MIDAEEDVKSRLNRETARIDWEELQRFYARGVVVAVNPGLDLIEVATHFFKDDKQAVELLMSEGAVFQPDDEQARDWCERKVSHWAIVLAPWVLVQEIL